jgi:hypothetical protein
MQGRTRFRIPERKGDAAYFFELEKSFAELAAVSHAAANPVSGSLLLLHNTDDAELIHYAEQERLFGLDAVPTTTPGLQLASNQLDRLDQKLKSMSRDTFNVNELIFDLLLAASFVQIIRGNLFGPSSSLLSYAVSILAIHRARQTGN